MSWIWYSPEINAFVIQNELNFEWCWADLAYELPSDEEPMFKYAWYLIGDL